jgi:uncharacterized protein YegL
MNTKRGTVLPIYLVADESGSMAGAVRELNAGLRSLHAELFAEPMAAAKVRLSIVGFAARPTVYLRLADMRREQALPTLGARGRTEYGALFAELAQIIPADVMRLHGEGYGVHRPTVVLLTDGKPTDRGWRARRNRLVDHGLTRGAPNLIACGIGAADPATLLAVATEPEYALTAVPGARLGEQITSFCVALTRTVVMTGRLLASGATHVTIPRPDGFSLAVDVI